MSEAIINRSFWRSSLGKRHLLDCAKERKNVVRRAYERSSAFKMACKAGGQAAFANGMALLKQIWIEEKAKLSAIWAAPDADEFAKKISDTQAKVKLEKELAEMEVAPKREKKKTDDFFSPKARAIAKAELAAQAKS